MLSGRKGSHRRKLKTCFIHFTYPVNHSGSTKDNLLKSIFEVEKVPAAFIPNCIKLAEKSQIIPSIVKVHLFPLIFSPFFELECC